jgi:DNA-binding transcriptional LysR family regulator
MLARGALRPILLCSPGHAVAVSFAPMELRQLRYFATVARELNFTRAAEVLHVAQPALSRQIRQLEEELGVSLLQRNSRGVALTPKGERFLSEAEAILEQTGRAMQRVQMSENATLNLGYVWGLFHSVAPRWLQRLRELDPGLAINLLDLSATQQGKALSAGKLDAGLIGFAFEAERAQLQMQCIGDCNFVIALPKSHSLARSSSLKLAALADEVFLLISDAHFPGAAQVINAACAAAGFRPRALQTAERGHTLLNLVAAGCGVALLPEPLRSLPHSGVVFRPPATPVKEKLYVAWRSDLPDRTLKQLLSAIPTVA